MAQSVPSPTPELYLYDRMRRAGLLQDCYSEMGARLNKERACLAWCQRTISFSCKERTSLPCRQDDCKERSLSRLRLRGVHTFLFERSLSATARAGGNKKAGELPPLLCAALAASATNKDARPYRYARQRCRGPNGCTWQRLRHTSARAPSPAAQCTASTTHTPDRIWQPPPTTPSVPQR